MNCSNPIQLKHSTPRSLGVLIPCGSCIHCRIQKSREWSQRLMHQLTIDRTALFITLTYSDDCLSMDYPTEYDGVLSLVDLQKFFKRLRLSLSPRLIKYYACGEYGELYGRPHYHCIIFGLSLADCVYRFDRWCCETVESAWPYGFVDVGTVTYDSCRYVSDYLIVEAKGFFADEYKIANFGRPMPFRVMSRGLGADFVVNNAMDLIQRDGYLHRGKHMSLPRYYLDKLKIYLGEDEFNYWRSLSPSRNAELVNREEIVSDGRRNWFSQEMRDRGAVARSLRKNRKF